MRSAHVGIILLVHENLDHRAQAIHNLAKAGCVVVFHVNETVSTADHDRFLRALDELPCIWFCAHYHCEWDTLGMVAATQATCEMMLSKFADPRHLLYLVSGVCLPVRLVINLTAYLTLYPTNDFIESTTVSYVIWSISGLDREPFQLRLLFARKRKLAVYSIGPPSAALSP